jgi:hypothetical protein
MLKELLRHGQERLETRKVEEGRAEINNYTEHGAQYSGILDTEQPTA